jgi:hypothetical protein
MRTSTSNLQSAKEGIGDFEPRAKGVLFGAGNQLFLTKEVLLDQSPICVPLRSNAEVIANKRCRAALPRKPNSAGPGTIGYRRRTCVRRGFPVCRQQSQVPIIEP